MDSSFAPASRKTIAKSLQKNFFSFSYSTNESGKKYKFLGLEAGLEGCGGVNGGAGRGAGVGGGWGVPYSDAFLQPVSKKIHPGKNSSFAWCGALKQPDTTNKNVFACQGVCVVPSEVHCCAE